MVSVRPFQFVGLPRFTKQQVALYESMARYLSYRPFAPTFVEGLEQLLEESLKVPVHLGGLKIHPVPRNDVAQLIPVAGCFALVSMAPGPHKLIVDLDQALASSTVDRLLGGSGDVARTHRPFTDIETGVFSYVLLRVLSHFSANWASGREMALTLDRFCGTWDELKPFVDSEPGYQMVGVNLNAAKAASYVRIFLPDTLVQKRFSAAPPQSKPTPQELAYMRRRFQSIGEKNVVAFCTAAKLQLTAVDIANVEAGDIIVLENHQLRKTPHGIEGELFVRIGAGRNGGFQGRLHVENDQHRLEVLQIVIQEQPLEEPMAEAPQDDNLPETEGLLRDVDASVSVELGRIRMNTAQVLRLRQGQILRLPRGANDPVDLVVNGKLFARGELIEVDGELGVRLIHVAGPE